MKLKMSASSQPLHKQMGVPEPAEGTLYYAQQFADRITNLHVNGMLTDSEAHKARKRVMRYLEKGGHC